MGMTSRERVVKAVNREEPDRIPIDIGGSQQTSFHREAQKKLLEYLDFSPFEEMFDIIQQLTRTDERISTRFGNDCYLLMPGNSSNWIFKVKSDEEANYFEDEWGILYKMPHDGLYFDIWESPLSKGTMDAVRNYAWPNPKDHGRIAGLKDRAKKAYEETEYALLMADGTWGIFLHTAVLLGFAPFYELIITNEKLIRTIFEKNLEFELAYWDIVLPEVKDYIQFVCLSDDLGSQYGPTINPKIYREWLKPLHKTLIEHIKKQANVKIFFHSCGAVSEFIPDFIDIGIDALNPVQISAKGMNSKRLKQEFGKDITFWGGGIDTQNVLSRGTPADVRKDVLRRMSDFGQGGGFVFTPVHNIQGDVPPENLITMYDTVLEHGIYPLQV